MFVENTTICQPINQGGITMRNVLMSLVFIAVSTSMTFANPALVNEALNTGLTIADFNPVLLRTDDPDFQCDPDSIWSQPFDGQEVYAVSDAGQDNQAVSADDFEGVSVPITGIEWWGGELECCWAGCLKTNLDFVITFYESGTLPGAVVYQETVTSDRIITSAFVLDNTAFGEVKKYSADFSSPVTLASGWVSVQAVDSGSCWFLWADAGLTSGTQEYVQDNGAGWQPGGYNADLALCLLSTDSDPHITLIPEISNRFGPADSVVTHSLTLRNRSGFDEEFGLSTTGNTWVTNINAPNPVMIPDGENTTITVDVTVPPGATPPDSDSCLLTAVGNTSGLETSAVLNTEVGDYPYIVIDPDSFDVFVLQNGTHEEIMTILNEGTVDLTWSVTQSETGARAVGNWENVTPPATPVQWPGSSFGEGKLFVIGGLTDTTAGTPFDGIQIYDTATGAWTNSATMVTPVFAPVAEYYQGAIYVVGGYASDAFVATNQVQIYDIAMDTWTTGSTMPTARGGNVGGLVDGKIYSLGGAPDGNFPEENVAYEYDIAANVWTTMNNGPVSSGGFGIILGGGTAYNGRIYAGGHFLAIHNQFYQFDPAGTGTWTTLATPPADFGNLTPSFIGLETQGILMGIGAGNNWHETGVTFAYEPLTNTWTNLNKPMTVAVLGGAAGAENGDIYFYGGTTGEGPVDPAPFMKTTYTNIPWLSTEPISGVTSPNNADDVVVSFDASRVNGIGVYEAWLVVNSNDPLLNPWYVPVTMTVSAETTPTPEPQCLNHGDVNFDGVITAADAQLAFNIALGLYTPIFEEECAADCNGDSVVTAGDAQQIFYTALNMDDCVDPI
jgi:hypothetical protein